MRASIWLRVASIVAFLLCAGHIMGIPWTPVLGPDQITLIEAMKSQRFEAMGSSRTYWDFYYGFGLIISFDLLVAAIVLWLLASLARTDPARVQPFIGAFFLYFTANAVISWRHFFIVPMLMSAAIAICLVVAFISARRGRG